MHWIEEHPYLAGGLAVGLLVLYLLFRNSGSSSGGGSSSVSTGGYDSSVAVAGLAAQTNLEASRIGLAGQIAGYNAAVNISALSNAADVEKTRIAANVYTEQIYATRDMAFHDTDAALTYGLASLTAQGIPTVQQATPSVVYQPIISGGQAIYQAGTATAGMNVPNAGSGGTGSFTPGETWDQYFAAALAGQPVNDPSQGFPGTGAVALRTSIWADAQTAWINDPYSPHNLPLGDYYDANGQLQIKA